MITASALVDKFKQALSEKWGYIWGTAGVAWTAAKQKQKVNYMISNYGANWQKNADAKSSNYYTAALYGAKWEGHTVADCSGLFAWAFRQLGGSIAHGSNSIYDKYCTSKGKITDDIRKKMLPGTAVFVDHSGNKSHIGLYVGNGKVIEAASTQAGVCTSNLSAGKWTYYGLLKGVEYSDQPDPGLPVLRKGDKGQYVTLMQTKLKNQGYDLGKCGVDGDFGSATEKAVKAFQRDHGIGQDGVCGAKTWAALQSDEPVQKYSVVIPHLTAERADQIMALYKGSYKEEERG